MPYNPPLPGPVSSASSESTRTSRPATTHEQSDNEQATPTPERAKTPASAIQRIAPKKFAVSERPSWTNHKTPQTSNWAEAELAKEGQIANVAESLLS